jgi:hypothetical protein
VKCALVSRQVIEHHNSAGGPIQRHQGALKDCKFEQLPQQQSRVLSLNLGDTNSTDAVSWSSIVRNIVSRVRQSAEKQGIFTTSVTIVGVCIANLIY